MEEYFDFLMFELKDISEEFDSPTAAAHEACLLFSVDKSGIPETFYRMYISNIGIDPQIMHNATCFFIGADLLKIHCDCDPSDKSFCDINGANNNPFYDIGKETLENNAERWYGIVNSIDQLRKSII